MSSHVVSDELVQELAHSIKAVEKQSCAIANRSAEFFDLSTEATFNMECVVSIEQTAAMKGGVDSKSKQNVPRDVVDCVEECVIGGEKVMRFVGRPVIWADLVDDATTQAVNAIAKAKQFPPTINKGSPRMKLPKELQPLFEGLHLYRKVVKQAFRSLRTDVHVIFVEQPTPDYMAMSLQDLIKQQPPLTKASLRSSLDNLSPHLRGVSEEYQVQLLNASLKLDRIAAGSNKSSRNVIEGKTRGSWNKKKQRAIKRAGAKP